MTQTRNRVQKRLYDRSLETGSIRAFFALCYGSSAIVASVAVWLSLNPKSAINSPFLLFVFSLLLLTIGIVAHQHFRNQQDAIDAETEKERELEDKLDEQREAIDTLADGLDVGIFICTAQAEILYANQAAEEIFRVENPIGKTVLSTTISYDLEQLVLQASKEGSKFTQECLITYPEERAVAAQAWPDGAGRRIFLSLHDLTPLRKLERIRQDFVANVSHEIRTPLATIRAMTESLVEDSSNQELQTRYYQKIMDEVDRLSTITQDLLILSTSESIQVRRQECDLSEVIRSVVNQLTYKATSKGLEFDVNAPETLPFQGNHSQLVQVVINLVDNAINYTQEGKVSVTLIDGVSTATIIIEDTGIGIPSDQIDRIFERFYRVDRARSRATGGTGLGLSIVKHIVEAHGGAISVTSSLGDGSKFVISLPKLESTDSGSEPE